MCKRLKRRGCSFHKASSFLFKAKRDEPEEFVEGSEQDKQKAAEENHDGQQRYRRDFLDGAPPLYGREVLFSCWLLVGQRFEVGVGGGRKRLNSLGAYCPEDQDDVDRRSTEENLTAQSVIEL